MTNLLLLFNLITLAFIYFRLWDIYQAIEFKGSFLEHNEYFNDGWLEYEKPLDKPVSKVKKKARK